MRPQPADRDQTTFDDEVNYARYIGAIRRVLRHYGYDGDPLSFLPHCPKGFVGHLMMIAAEDGALDEVMAWFDDDGNPLPHCPKDVLDEIRNAEGKQRNG